MPKSPIHVWAVGSLRLEAYQSNGRGLTFELMLDCGGYRLSMFPHELPYLEAIVSKAREALKVPALALDERRMA